MVDQDLHAAAFPRLDKAQLTALDGCPLSKLKHYHDGEKLFEAGQCDCNFYVVKTGTVEMVDDAGDEPKVVATLGTGEFTGEVAQLTGGPAIFSGVAQGDSDVFEVSNDALREIINVHPNLGDVILRAFMARRHLLHEMGDFTGLRVIGSRYSQGHPAGPRVPGQEPGAIYLDGPGGQPAGQAVSQAGRTDRGRHARGHLGPQAAPAQPVERGAGAGPGPPPAARTHRVRPGRGRGRPGGAGRGRLRRLRGTQHGRPGAGCAGGQAGRSMRIENYLGFPTGITGRELAENAVVQANKFGRTFPSPRRSRACHSTTSMPCCTSTTARRSRPSAC